MKYLLILLTCTLVYCSSDQRSSKLNGDLGSEMAEEDQFESTTMSAPMSAEPPSPPSDEKSSEIKTQIIKTGQLRFEVDSIKNAKSKVDQLLKAADAYYENEQYQSYGSRNSYHLNIRIPNDKFEEFIVQLENNTGKLLSKNISAEDVTEEFVDLNIRLESNLAYLKQYQEILKKAKTIKEILDVQEKIRRLTAEIDSKKGRLKYLKDQVKYSTLQLELTQKVIQSQYEDSFVKRIIKAFENGFQSFLSFLVILVNLWPFFILALVFWLMRHRIKRLFQSRKKQP